MQQTVLIGDVILELSRSGKKIKGKRRDRLLLNKISIGPHVRVELSYGACVVLYSNSGSVLFGKSLSVDIRDLQTMSFS